MDSQDNTASPPLQLWRQSARRIAQNFSWLAVAQVVYRFTFFALIVVLAHTVSVEDYALLTLLLVYTTVWHPVFNFGLGIIGVREMAQQNISASQFIGRVLPLKIALSAGGLALMVGVGIALGYGDQSLTVLVLVSAGTVAVSLAEFFHTPFSAAEEMHVTATLTVCERLAVAIPAGAAVMLGFGRNGFAYAYALGAVAGTALAMTVWHRRFGPTLMRLDRAMASWYFRESLPLAITWFFAIGYGRAGLFVLDQFRGRGEVAALNTAFFVVASVQMVVTVLMQALFPVLSRVHKSDPRVLRRRVWGAVSVGFPAVIAVSASLLAIANALVPVLFGSAFDQVPALLGVMIWSLPLSALNSLFGTVLQASNRQRVVAWLMGIGLAVAVGISVPLAIQLGATGVGLSAVIAEAVILIAFIGLLNRSDEQRIDSAARRVLIIGGGGLSIVLLGTFMRWSMWPRFAVLAVVVVWSLHVAGIGRDAVRSARTFLSRAGHK